VKYRSPFRRENRRSDGTWAAEDATEDNIKGTSIDFHDPVWPRWKKTPPPDTQGEFVSDEPFFDIDEITQTATFYPPGKPLVDKNLDGNPASRQRVRDGLTGNLWRRRLLVAGADEAPGLIRVQAEPKQQSGAQQGRTVERDMEPPNFRKDQYPGIPGLYRFTPTERWWSIDPQGRPMPFPPNEAPIIDRDDWPPPNGDGIPDSRQPGSPSYNGMRAIRPKTS
jgi:hypothetical protein